MFHDKLCESWVMKQTLGNGDEIAVVAAVFDPKWSARWPAAIVSQGKPSSLLSIISNGLRNVK